MGHNNLQINYNTFQDMLIHFSDLVHEKKAEKMPYQMWRELTSIPGEFVNIFVDDTYIELSIYGEYTKFPWTFRTGDNSFGDFLYENLLNPNPNNNITKNKKENNTMKFNFDFGPVNANAVRMSVYGLAVKNKTGTWVSFDVASGNIVDVDVFNFDGAKFLYKMPVAVKDVAVGDVVIHNSAPMFVLAVGMKTLTVVDVVNGERKDIMLARSPFGFDFVTKVVNFLGNMTGGAATAENPFGNMWMLMAMSGDTSFEDMLPMALMAGGNFDMSNPMMMWALMGNRTNDPMMLAMAMGMFNKPAAPAHSCTCGGHCDENHTQG